MEHFFLVKTFENNFINEMNTVLYVLCLVYFCGLQKLNKTLENDKQKLFYIGLFIVKQTPHCSIASYNTARSAVFSSTLKHTLCL